MLLIKGNNFLLKSLSIFWYALVYISPNSVQINSFNWELFKFLIAISLPSGPITTLLRFILIRPIVPLSELTDVSIGYQGGSNEYLEIGGVAQYKNHYFSCGKINLFRSYILTDDELFWGVQYG